MITPQPKLNTISVIVIVFSLTIINLQGIVSAAGNLGYVPQDFTTEIKLEKPLVTLIRRDFKMGDKFEINLPNKNFVKLSDYPQISLNNQIASFDIKSFTEAGKYIFQGSRPGRLGGKLPWNIDVTVARSQVNMTELDQKIRQILGTQASKFGIYVEDLTRLQKLNINGGVEYWPGSVGKLPVAILALRDIDSGKIKWEDTFPVQSLYKHSTSDAIGALANGTRVTIRTLLFETIHNSNNSAMYHLRAAIGGVDKVYERTKTELGATSFNDLPHHLIKAQEAGKVLKEVYLAATLKPSSRDYLIDLMKNTAPSLRDGIPYALRNTKVKVANKVGFLYGKGKDAYNDVAIVYGEKTNYILVVVDKEMKYEAGRTMVRRVAETVHNFLDK